MRLAAAITLALALGAAKAAPTSPSSTRCAVTIPRETAVNSGFGAAAFNYGNSRLRADLYWPQGTIAAGVRRDGGSIAIINRDGSIWLKLGWWRGLAAELKVTGRRLDRRAPRLRADVPGGYGSRGFVPSGLTFPTVGCWRVVGKLGPARLTFVVRVTKLRPR